MPNDKIDSLKIGSTTYDIDLPPDATPSINYLTVNDAGVYFNTSNRCISSFHDNYVGSVYDFCDDTGSGFFQLRTLNWDDTPFSIHYEYDDGEDAASYDWIFPMEDGTLALRSDLGCSSVAYCSTAASTAAKTASMPYYNRLSNGTRILLRTTISNTATSNVTLNVNSTGAKTVKIAGSAVTSSNWPAGDYIAYYNGTNWDLTRIYLTDNNTNYYPIRSYTSGLQISTYSGSTDCQLYVPNATTSQKGVATIMTQTQFDTATGGTSPSSTVNPIVDLIYPIGSIFMSASASADPNSLFTGTTWVAIQDSFLLAKGSSYPTLGATGGTPTHSHTLSQAYAQITAFNDGSYYPVVYKEVNNKPEWNSSAGVRSSAYYSTTKSSTYGAQVAGQTDQQTNMPPYIVVNVWKRTA